MKFKDNSGHIHRLPISVKLIPQIVFELFAITFTGPTKPTTTAKRLTLIGHTAFCMWHFIPNIIEPVQATFTLIKITSLKLFDRALC